MRLDEVPHIRKWVEQGISQVELAGRIGVNEMTIANREIKGVVPANRYLERLTRKVEGLTFSFIRMPDAHKIGHKSNFRRGR